MYARYQDYLQTIQTINEPFKRNPAYTYVLEHVSQNLGNEYMKRLLSLLPVDQITAFCKRNDAIGSPVLATIDGLPFPVSPTSLRYLYHACLIRDHMKDTNTYVEIGGGYGGLCLALDFLEVPISTYHIIDIDEALALIRRVLDACPPRFNVHLHSARTYGAGISGPYGLISNYCFSEIEPVHQQGYLSTVFPPASKGFLIWNHVPLFSIGKQVTVVPEEPMTGPGNLFVTFG